MPPPIPLSGASAWNPAGSQSGSASSSEKRGRMASHAASGDEEPAIACSTSETNARTTCVSRTNSPSIVSSIFARLRPRAASPMPALRTRVVPYPRRTPCTSGEGRHSMAWRVDEVWLDADLLWFREERRTPFGAAALAAPAFAGDLLDRRLFAPIETGLEASRRRRLASRAARRRKLATRTVPAVALVLGSATMLPIAALRHGSAGAAGPLLEDPPSLTFRADEFGFHLPRKPALPVRVERSRGELLSAELESVSWQRAT